MVIAVVSFFGAGASAVFAVAVVTVVTGVTFDAFRTFGLCAPLLEHPAEASRFVESTLTAAYWSIVSVRCANDVRIFPCWWRIFSVNTPRKTTNR